ncbi:MAG: heme o synthase [Actinomycetota bacterium]
MRRFRILAGAAATATFVLIAVGGLVRATGSGLGCPGWPRCFGKWIPPLEYHAIIEYTHRLVAGIVIVLIGALAVSAWRHHRSDRRILWPSLAAVGIVLFQAALGGIVVRQELKAALVTAHFATAMVLAGVLTFVLVSSFLPQEKPERRDRPFLRLTMLTLIATFGLLLVGAYVRGAGAGLAFRDWPLMDGKLVPALGGIATPMFLHRLLAAAVCLLVIYTAVRARASSTRNPALIKISSLVVVLFAVQILVGAANVWTGLSTASVVAHVTLSALTWAAVVALATAATRLAVLSSDTQPAEPSGRSLRESTVAYFQLTKPRIIVLLLITTVPAMILASGSLPPFGLVFATLLGGTLAAGSANSINCYLDRDIDEVMRRTRRRPLPSHRVTPDDALRFGFVLGSISFFFLSIAVNVVAATLSLAAIAFYVFVYTLWLKRSTEQNIVIGGAAGAVPALVGWAAVTGTVGLPAIVLFGIVFVWTPPHFWALSMQYRDDYASAGVPMMPVVRGRDETLRQILLYSLVLFAVSLLLYPVGHLGAVYLASALLLGGIFVYRALSLRKDFTQARAMSLFKYSIVYLALLFAAVAVDSL